ncbi:diaminobutyrate acetyltransferase [Salinisphaera sp. SPP-AMP-43]|uniref:diaminobutyrate acetyltransferase n=1 Tax=Salinisphaera sp. SPP-AMP-43 TaxID=3121288 RepID=UPI003C6E54A8
MTAEITVREPDLDDGSRLHQFVRALHPLAQNSVYCNLLQCTHFSETSAVAERDGELVGFVSGYLHPKKAETYFLWQMGVSEAGRGLKLPVTMLQHILARPICRGVATLEATVTASNRASQGVFHSLARAEEAECQVVEGYLNAERFGADNDYPEDLYQVGPLRTPKTGT